MPKSVKLVGLVLVVILLALPGNLNQINWAFALLLLILAYGPNSADEENKILRVQLEESRQEADWLREQLKPIWAREDEELEFSDYGYEPYEEDLDAPFRRPVEEV